MSGAVVAAPFLDTLAGCLAEAGFSAILRHDPVGGFRAIQPPGRAAPDGPDVFARLGLTAADGAAAAGPDLLGATIERLATLDGPPVGLVVDFASRLIARPDALTPPEQALFVRGLVTGHAAVSRPVGPNRAPRFNTVIWVAEREGDLPDWLVVDNPKLRHIPLAPPDRAARRVVARSVIRGFPAAAAAQPPEVETAVDQFVDGTEGMRLLDLTSIAQLARTENVALDQVAEAVRRYKVGVADDAWKRLERSRIGDGFDTVSRRVIGQDHAVVHILDIVKRAAIGLGGGRRGGRPRGVAFLAGPTGVGKTELAKAVTQLLFGDESAYIRFDMSEFSAEHADQRLIGAPPGYVGYDAGGELTNAVREKPFSVVLFDEIEKAHPRILDKFLQVLDDGVLTSGRGDRVYFSEALILFTTNLGVSTVAADGGRVAAVTPEMDFPQIQARVRGEIEVHFKQVLNRPEILNRIGDNVIVFDFIRPDVARRIFEGMVASVLEDAAGTGREVRLDTAAMDTLRDLCTSDLANGGRGIRNKIEAHLINPLARALFDRAGDGPAVIREIRAGAVTELTLEDA